MRIPRFYLPVTLRVGATVTLDGTAFHHAVRVLRLKPGAPLILFNGTGSAFTATLTDLSKREAEIQVTDVLPDEAEAPLSLILAQGISRGDKMDYTLQKAVELGVSAIQPLLTERSATDGSGDRWVRKQAHWQGIVIGACEQCGRYRLPVLQPPMPLGAWLAGPTASPMRLVLDPSGGQSLRTLPVPTAAVTLLVGPEGGLSATEIGQAQAAGWTGIRLGPRVLRTETAGLAALAAIQALWGDWD